VAVLDQERAYSPDEAFQRIKETSSARFPETVDVAIKLGVDAKSGEQVVRGVVTLPHGPGKSPRVLVFARGEAASQAEAAGADEVGGEELVQKIEAGFKDFDVLVATRDMMRVVGRLGKRLGPRMPNPKAGTVGEDVASIVRELKSGRVQFRMDRGGVIQAPIGRVSYTPEQLKENFSVLMGAIMRARPASAKGQYLRKISISSTMGPSLLIDTSEAQSTAEVM
jgi:large subunit ribosomal protein L1